LVSGGWLGGSKTVNPIVSDFGVLVGGAGGGLDSKVVGETGTLACFAVLDEDVVLLHILV